MWNVASNSCRIYIFGIVAKLNHLILLDPKGSLNKSQKTDIMQNVFLNTMELRQKEQQKKSKKISLKIAR